MTVSPDQYFESFVPVYDVIPEDWESARQFLVEQLKRISNAINAREIGFFLEEELLSGKQFIPTVGNTQEFRSVFRKVIDMGPIVVGANPVPHGISVTASTSNIMLWVSASNSAGLEYATYVAPEVEVVGANIIFTSPKAYNRCFAFWEYMQEL